MICYGHGSYELAGRKGLNPNTPYLAIVFAAYGVFLLGGVAASLRSLDVAELLARLERLPERGARHQLLKRWRTAPERVDATLDLGRSVCDVGLACSVLWAVGANLPNVSPAMGMLSAMGIALVLGMVFGRLLPKAVAAWNPDFFLALFAVVGPVVFGVGLLGRVVDSWARGLTRLLGGDPERVDRRLTDDDIEEMIRRGEEQGDLDQEQTELLSSVIEFADTRVKDVMVPRTDAECFEVGTSIEGLLDRIDTEGYSRYPVYDDSIDKIVGVVVVKDLIPYLRGPQRRPFRLAEHLRPAYFVPESKPIADLLKELQGRKIQLAIVVDEFGGTAGLVSLEDIVEEVFGEIYDEFDVDEDVPSLTELSDDVYVTDARVSIRELEEELELDFPDDANYDTVGGFVVTSAARVPGPGYQVKHANWCFRVIEADRTRVRKVRIERLDGDGDGDPAAGSGRVVP